MKYHEIGERFEYDGVVLEVADYNEYAEGDVRPPCYMCYCDNSICTNSVSRYCSPSDRRDLNYAYYKLVEQCKTKDMEQKKEIKVQGTSYTFATKATNSLKIEDLKNGDFVAFDYNGNTAVTRLTSDDGDFMYAVSLWHDSNFVGDTDAIWYADNLKDVNSSISPITNLHYATADEIKRWANALTESFERSEQMQREKEPKMLPDCVTTEDYIKSLTNKLALTLQAKDADYGNAFSEMFDELGIDYAYGKLREKMNRIKVLRNQPNMVENEGLEDALLDTAGYAILTLVELKKRKKYDDDYEPIYPALGLSGEAGRQQIKTNH